MMTYQAWPDTARMSGLCCRWPAGARPCGRGCLPRTILCVERLQPDSFRELILDRALALTEPEVTGYAHFAGEFRNAQDLRAMFKSRLGLDKTSQLSVAFWREGVPGFGS